MAVAGLPTGSSTLFSGSGNCAQCHASDGQANTENGVDVSPLTQWRSTMMANAARDPLRRAKVSAEAATFPALREAIETKYTRCHAPMGHTEAEIYGPYSDPLVGPMLNMSGYTPVQATHTATSEMCATCHKLFTAHVNDQGGLEGSFPEQTPYLEWKNSRFQDDGIECQGCYMPSNGPVTVLVQA